MIRSTTVSLVLLVSTLNAYADWGVKNVDVVKVMQYQRGSTAIARVYYEVGAESTFSPGFTCAPNTEPLEGSNVYQAAYWSSATDNLHQVMISQLLAARAQSL